MQVPKLNHRLSIQVFLRQAYDTGDYNYEDTYKYVDKTTGNRLSKFLYMIENGTTVIDGDLSNNRKLSKAQKMMAIKKVSYVNIAPPLVCSSDDPKNSNWNDIRRYFSMQDYARGRECYQNLIDYDADVVVFVGTFGLFYDLFKEQTEKDPEYLGVKPSKLMLMDDLSRNKVFSWKGKLFIEMKHISSGGAVPNKVLETIASKVQINSLHLKRCIYCDEVFAYV